MNPKLNELICKLLDVFQVAYIVIGLIFTIWLCYAMLTT